MKVTTAIKTVHGTHGKQRRLAGILKTGDKGHPSRRVGDGVGGPQNTHLGRVRRSLSQSSGDGRGRPSHGVLLWRPASGVTPLYTESLYQENLGAPYCTPYLFVQQAVFQPNSWRSLHFRDGFTLHPKKLKQMEKKVAEPVTTAHIYVDMVALSIYND